LLFSLFLLFLLFFFPFQLLLKERQHTLAEPLDEMLVPSLAQLTYVFRLVHGSLLTRKVFQQRLMMERLLLLVVQLL